MKVPFVDLSREASSISSELIAITSKVINSGQYISGPHLKLFEQKFAEFCGVKYAVGVGSGTDALFLSLKALGIGSGDEVITTTYTFYATIGAIVTSGAIPVFCDCNMDYNIDPEQIKNKIS